MKVKGVVPKKSQAQQLQDEAETIQRQLEKGRQNMAEKAAEQPVEPRPAPIRQSKTPKKPAELPKRARRKVRPPEEVTRLTVDLPSNLYDEISQEAHDRYMTLKGYVVTILLARKPK